MIRRFLLVTLVTAACSTTGSSSDHSTLDTIPKAAADALRAQAGGAEISHVSRETEHGEDYYEGRWHENGLSREATVSAAGKVVELEKELAPDEVPVPVRDGASKALPKGSPIAYELLMDGTYEAETIVGGKEYEATFSADGTRQKGEDDDGEDEDDDDEHEHEKTGRD